MSDRVLLTSAFALVVVLLWLLMLKGWRGRVRRQGDLPPPPTPPEHRGEVVVPATRGLFVGTTFADDWLDRVAVHGLAHRAAGWIRLDTAGVTVEREGLPDLFLPYADVERAGLGDALAGKVMGQSGLVLLDWRLGSRVLTSGFRADDHGAHRRIVDAVTAQLPSRPQPAPSQLAPSQLAPSQLAPSDQPAPSDQEAS